MLQWSPLMTETSLCLHLQRDDRDADIAYADDRKTPPPNAPNIIVLEKKSGRLVARRFHTNRAAFDAR